MLGVLPVGPPGVVGQSSFLITLSFDDGQSTPSAVTGVAEEGGAQTVRVVATASAATSAAVTVNVTAAAGTATATTDYAISASSWTVTIANGDTVGHSAALTVTPVNDTRVEGDETIVFSATTSATGYSAIADVSLNIEDADVITLSFDDGQSTPSALTGVAEEGGAQMVRVVATASAATSAAVTVNVTAAAGTATAATDYAISASSWTVTIASGDTVGRAAAALTVTPVSDLLVEGDETIVFSAATTAAGYAAVADVGLNIVDDDSVIRLSFVDAAGEPVGGLGEDDGGQTVRLVASVPAGVPVSANVEVSVTVDDSAETATPGAGGDYTASVVPSSLTLSIASGGTVSGSSGDMVFTPLSDRVFEDHEIVRRFTGTAPAPYTVEDADLLILDADRTIVVTMDNQGSNTNHHFFSDEDGTFVLRETGDPVNGPQWCSCHDGPRPWFTFTVAGVTSSTYSENLTLWFDGFGGTAEMQDRPPDLPGRPDISSTAIRPFYQKTYGEHHYQPTLNAGSVFLRYRPSGDLQNTIDSVWDFIAEPDETFTVGLRPIDGFEIVNANGLIIDDDVQVYMVVQNNPTLAEGSSGTDLNLGTALNAQLNDLEAIPGYAGQVCSNCLNPERLTNADRSVLTSATVISFSVAEGPGLLSADDFSFDWARRSATIPAGDTGDSGIAKTLENLSIADNTVVEGPKKLRIVGRPALAAAKPDGSPTDQVVTFNNAQVDVTVTDDDADITLSVSPGTVVEKAGGQSVTVVAEFAGSSSVLTSATDVVVQVAGGTATLTSDFTTGLTDDRLTVRIPAGLTSGSKSFTLTALDDGVTETGGETVTFAGHGTTRVGGQTVTVTGGELTIVDSGSEVVLSLTDTGASPAALSAVGEDGGAERVRVTATADSVVADNPLEVAVAVGAAGSTAGAPGDYTVDESSVTVTIAVGDTSGSADVVVTPVADTVTEDHETILFTGAATGYVVAPVSLEITDADRSVMLELGFNPRDYPSVLFPEYSGDGGAQWRSVTARLEGVSSTYSGGIRGRVITESGTGAAGASVSSTGSGSGDIYNSLEASNSGEHRYVNIGAGNTSSAAAWFVSRVLADDAAEPIEYFDFTLSGLTDGFTVVPVKGAVVDLVDTAVVLTPGGTVTEGGDGSGLSVTAGFPSGVASNTIGSDLVVTLGAPEAGTAGSDDFLWTPPDPADTVTITAGQTASPGGDAVSLDGLSITEDTVVEDPETIKLTGSYTLDGETRETEATLTVLDNDANVVLSVSPGTVVEGSTEEVRVTARFAGSSSVLTSDTTVTVTIAAGTATLTTDFTTTSSQVSVVIPAGSLSGSATFNLTAVTDSDMESAETVALSGAGTIGSQTLTVTGAAVNIVDSGIRLAVDADTGTTGDQSSVGEDAMTKTVEVEVTLPAASSSGNGAVTVGLNVVGGTAVLDDNSDGDSEFGVGEDFRVTYPSGQSNVSVEVAEGDTTGSAMFDVVLNNDNTAEGSAAETVVIEGADVSINSTSYEVVSTSFGITDSSDDASPTTIGLTLLDSEGEDLTEVREDDGTVRVRVKAALEEGEDGQKVLPRSVTVPLTVGMAGGALAVHDFTRVSSLAVTIPPYEDEGTVEFDLELIDDTRPEGAEELTVHAGTLGAGLTGLGFTAVESDSFTIVDNDMILGLLDAGGEPLTRVLEGSGSQVRAQLSYPGMHFMDTPRVVRVTVEGGTAAGSDFRIPAPPGDVFFPIRQNSAAEAFGLNTVNDRAFEGDETLRVSAVSEGFDIAPVELIIQDNDIRLSLNQASVRENEGRITRRVTARAGSAPPEDLVVTVTVGGGRPSGNGYTSLSPRRFSVTIPAGEQSGSGSFSLTLVDDATPGNSKSVSVTGSASGFDVSSARLTITDDGDTPPPAGGGGGGGGGVPPPSGGGGGGGGGGAPPPAGGGGGGGGGAPPPAGGNGGAQPPAQPPAPACVGRFCDDDGNVHQDNIERIAVWRITLGCDAEDATKYCPDAQITRRQMSAFLHRAVSQRWTIEAPEGIELSDVGADEWFRPFAEWVVSVGAFSAPNGVFDPGGVVTRADMAIMMIGAFPHLDAVPTEASRFGDVEGLSPEVLAALEGMYQTGVTRGCSAEPLNYCPAQPVTRAQMASFFVRAVNLAPAGAQPAAGT